jgi:hypothetical protein
VAPDHFHRRGLVRAAGGVLDASREVAEESGNVFLLSLFVVRSTTFVEGEAGEARREATRGGVNQRA